MTGKTAYRVLLAAYPQLVKERWFYPLMPGDSPFTGPQSLHEEHVLSYARMALVLVGPPVLSAIELYLYGDRVGWSAASFIVSAAVCLVMVTVGIWTLKVATASIDKSR